MAEVFQDVLEGKLADMVQEVVPDLKSFVFGEPYKVPVSWFPMSVVFTRRQEPAEDREYAPQETLVEHWRYECYVSIELLQTDTSTMRLDQRTLRARVPVYDGAKDRIEAMRLRLNQWLLHIDEANEEVVANAGAEDEERATYALITSRNTGIEDRGDNFTQRAVLEFQVFTDKRRP